MSLSVESNSGFGEAVTVVDEAVTDSFGRVFDALDARLDPERPIRRRIRVLEFEDMGAAWKPLWKERAYNLGQQHWPYLSTLRDWGETREGKIFYLTDAIGRRLSAVLSGNKGIGAQAAQAALEHLLISLESLHKRGLAHGDVRPERVLLVGEGERSEALLSDAEIGPLTWWSGGLVRDDGAVGYYPPEWKGKAAEPNPQADLYALGLTACETVLGRDAVTAVRRGTNGRQRIIGALKRARVSAPCRKTIGLLLAESLTRRPAHAGAALREWHRCQENARWRPLAALCVALALLIGFLLISGASSRGDLASRLAHAEGRVNELQGALDAERTRAAPELERLSDSLDSLHAKVDALQPAHPDLQAMPKPTAKELAKIEWMKASERS
ncbi:MAG: hypothetical protein KY475_10185, partial [Planctomycetes bacterium]|nr:hypothetical protein [Planctomycetota bacterium]